MLVLRDPLLKVQVGGLLIIGLQIQVGGLLIVVCGGQGASFCQTLFVFDFFNEQMYVLLPHNVCAALQIILEELHSK